MKENKIGIWAAGLGLLAIALLLRLIRLDMGFGRDEIITMTDFVSLPWGKIFADIPYPNNHLLNTLLAKAAIAVFGEHEWSARLPSLIIGSLTPATAFLVFRKRFSGPVSFGAGLLLCASFWPVWFSQDCRGYAGLICFGLLGTWLFLQYLEHGQRQDAALYAVCASLAVWFHLYGLFLIAGQGVWAVIQIARGKIPAGRLALPALAVALSGLPYLAAAPQLYHYAAEEATRPGSRVVNLALVREALMLLAGTRSPALAVALGLLCLPGLAMVTRNYPGLVVIYLTAAAALLFFTLGSGVFIYPRFLSFLIPLFMLSLMANAEFFPNRPLISGKIRPRTAGSCLAALLLTAAMLPGLLAYYRLGKSGLKEAAAHLRENHPGREVLAYGVAAETVRYYLPEARVIGEEPLVVAAFLKGKMIVVLSSNSRSAAYALIESSCRREKVWPSSGPPENAVGLVNCP